MSPLESKRITPPAGKAAGDGSSRIWGEKDGGDSQAFLDKNERKGEKESRNPLTHSMSLHQFKRHDPTGQSDVLYNHSISNLS